MARSADLARKLTLLSLSTRLRRERREAGLREVRDLSDKLEQHRAHIKSKEQLRNSFSTNRDALTLLTRNRADLAARFQYAASCSILEQTLEKELSVLQQEAEPVELALEAARLKSRKAAGEQQKLEERSLALRRKNSQTLRALGEEVEQELAPLRSIGSEHAANFSGR